VSRIAIRYSKALFDLALEEKLIDEIHSDLEQIKEVCVSNPEFQHALINPLIDDNLKATLLKEIFENKLHPLAFKFLALLSKKKRLGFLIEMIEHYMEKVLEYKGVLSALLISAGPLDPAQVDSIRDRIESITGKSVILSEHIDKLVIGGFVVKIKDTVIDLSIKTQLDKLRAQLVQG
jgi:F-type H+-transporting ATPase subunit delta